MHITERADALVVVSCLLLGACATLPDVTVNYRLAQSKVGVKVVRTVACDAANNIIVVNAVTPSVTHFAEQGPPVGIRLASVGGPFTDSDVKFELYEDGRLKSINATTTGQGEAILKTVVTIAQTIAIFGLDGGAHLEECALIKKAGDGKPLTLLYEDGVDIGKSGQQMISGSDATSVYAQQLEKAIGGVCAFVDEKKNATAPAVYKPRDGDILVKARQPGSVKLRVTAGTKNGCEGDQDAWTGEVLVAQLGAEYSIPMPLTASFGKQSLAVSFAESGALTSMQYISSTGMGQGLNVISAGLTAAQNETAQKALAVKAEADLIAQQQRLTQCLADRVSCR